MFILLKVRKNIFKTTFILRSANINISWKNKVFLNLFYMWKLAKTILNVLKIEKSIFCTLMLIERIFRSSFEAYPRVIVLILLTELIRAWIWTLFFFKPNRITNAKYLI